MTIRIRLRGRELTFPGAEVRFGRDPAMDVYSDNPFVSRHHAVLRPDGQDWVLEDTNSRRGTFVEGQRIERATISAPSTVWLAEPGRGQVLLLLPTAPGSAVPTGIFISYRRDDTSGYAGRLYDRLSAHFLEERLFWDIDTVEPGTDFVQRIERAVDSCKVLIVIIGKEWLDAKDSDGRRRLDNPGDFVRLEIAAALPRPHVRVIPVLVEGAVMPQAESLPVPIRELAHRNALAMTDTHWDYDLSRPSKRRSAPHRSEMVGPKAGTHRRSPPPVTLLLHGGVYPLASDSGRRSDVFLPGSLAGQKRISPSTAPNCTPSTGSERDAPPWRDVNDRAVRGGCHPFRG
ncbi:MAG: FHA domain-containing protein [Egibacteraceae bacterium]